MLDGTGSAVRPARASSLTGSSPAAPARPAGTLRPVSSAPVAGAGPGGAAAPPVPPDDEPGGLVVSWTGGVGMGAVLAAAHRCARHRAGLDLPAWGEVGSAGESEGRPVGEPQAGPQDDELGEEALRAATEGRGRVLPAAVLGGHAIMAPGPDLAGWLACGQAADRDDAALVNSITAWRKVTSWAQAQELAAVAELARRRGVPGARDTGGEDCDRAADAGDRDPVADAGQAEHDPVAELEAGFAPNEVALALTLTQGGAEYWMDLAVSLSRRLPATLAALGEGAIDLNRARLIDQFTGSLDIDHARAVERRVLARAQHQTSGQLRASLQRAVLAADPAAAERRRQQAEARAWVALSGDHDGTASLSGRCLPAAQAAAAWARICAMAKAMEAAGAGGGMDLLRAQVFVGLLLGTLPLIPPAAAGPDDAGPDDAGPDDSRPDDKDPGRGGWDGSALEDSVSEDSASEDCASEDCASEDCASEGRASEGRAFERRGLQDRDRERRAYQGGTPVSSGHDRVGRGLVRRPDDGDSAGAGKASARHPADTTADGLLPSPAWPPLPGPGATPAPGCARPVRASPGGSRDRDGPPGSTRPRESPRPPGDRGPPGSPDRPGRSRPPGNRAPDGHSRLAGRAVLCVPWRTLAGWSSEPGELGRLGPVTAGVARDLALAAVADVTCRWRVIVVGRPGRAIAVTKIRRVSSGVGSAAAAAAGGRERPEAVPGVVGRVTLTIPAGLLNARARLATQDLAAAGGLAKVLERALRAGADAFSADRSRAGPGRCTHEQASPGYRVPDPMRALVEARDRTCGFPTCRQPAWRCEQDHTVAYRLGGATCPCNLSAECARHHHLKHLPSWRLEQPRPGILIWTTPARLTHTVTPGPYPA
jgi:Domain of unknown function (DUF222)